MSGIPYEVRKERFERFHAANPEIYARLVDSQEPDLKGYFELRDRPGREAA